MTIVPPALAPPGARSARWRMKLSRAVAEFVNEARMSKAKATAEAYGSDLQPLVAMARPDTVLSFTPELVTTYFLAQSHQGKSIATLHRRAAALREFARWGIRKGLWTKNPVDDPAYRFKRPDAVPRPFAADESERIMTLPLTGIEKVVRALLYYTGLRVTPICHIRVSDVSFAHITLCELTVSGSIRTVNKGNRQQLVFMKAELREILADWLRDNPGKGYDPLIRYANGKPYQRRAIERMTAAWGEVAGVADCKPHRFRHTFASDLLRKGVDIRVIQKLLGHADIKSTLVYTKVADPMLAAAILQR